MVALKFFVFAMCFVALSAQEVKQPAEILTDKSLVREDGYDFEYKTSDGTSRKEQAQLITVGEHQGIGVKGTYSYVAPDGVEYTVNFTADDKGYRPEIRVSPEQSQ